MSDEGVAVCSVVLAISQYGSTRSSAPERISMSIISRACSPVSGCETSSASISTPSFFAYSESNACSASMISIQPSEVIYLGDDRRDVIAANNAGMISMIARYGYLEAGDDGKNWNAHHIIDKPIDLLNYLNSICTLMMAVFLQRCFHMSSLGEELTL